MKIETTPREDHQVTMTVEVEAERMEAAKRRAARKIAEKGKIPGFRPGKAPYDVVRRYYGDAAITQEAVEILVDEVYPAALKEADIKPAAMGQLENIESVEPPVFKFSVPLLPTVDLGAYQSVRKTYEFAEPDDAKVEQSLADLRRMYSRTETVERAVAEGDFVMVDVKGELEAPPADFHAEAISREGFPAFVRADEKESEWPFPGFSRRLIGLNPGDAADFTHTFSVDHDDEALRGQTAKFNVTVKTVRGVTLPELNDEFAQNVGGGQTLDELKTNLRESLKRQAQAEYDDVYFSDLIEQIKAGAVIKYPPQVLEHEAEHVTDELKHRLAEQHMDLNAYYKMRETTAEKFHAEEVHPVAKKRLERSLIIDELARAEGIKVEGSELEAAFRDTWATLTATDEGFSKATKGGTKASKELIDAVTMDTANRMIVARVLDRLKTIATGEAPAEAPMAESAAASAESSAPEAEESRPAKKKSAPAKKAETKAAKKTPAKAEKIPAAKKSAAKKPAVKKPAAKKPAAKKSGKK